MKEVEIYTDGACSGNPGAGGWCAILLYKGNEKVVSGYNKNTTNNRMELFAVIQGLKQLKERCSVKLYSDSAYVCNAFLEGWLENWKNNNWKNKQKDDVKNVDLWKQLLIELEKQDVEFCKVKGHANVKYNEKCDKYARDEIKNAVTVIE